MGVFGDASDAPKTDAVALGNGTVGMMARVIAPTIKFIRNLPPEPLARTGGDTENYTSEPFCQARGSAGPMRRTIASHDSYRRSTFPTEFPGGTRGTTRT